MIVLGGFNQIAGCFNSSSITKGQITFRRQGSYSIDGSLNSSFLGLLRSDSSFHCIQPVTKISLRSAVGQRIDQQAGRIHISLVLTGFSCFHRSGGSLEINQQSLQVFQSTQVGNIRICCPATFGVIHGIAGRGNIISIIESQITFRRQSSDGGDCGVNGIIFAQVNGD